MLGYGSDQIYDQIYEHKNQKSPDRFADTLADVHSKTDDENSDVGIPFREECLDAFCDFCFTTILQRKNLLRQVLKYF